MRFSKPFGNIKESTNNLKKPFPGGYVLKVIDVEETQSKSGVDMLVLHLDIAKGEYKGAQEKYPLRSYHLLDEKSEGRVKGLLNSFAKSNPEKISESELATMEEFNFDRLRGLYVGAVLREEEYLNKVGEIKSSLRIFYICSVQTIDDKDFQIPTKQTILDKNGKNNRKISSDEFEKIIPQGGRNDPIPF